MKPRHSASPRRTAVAEPEISRLDDPKIEISGSPVYSGRVLEHGNPELLGLRTVEDHLAFALKLRGQFAIINRTPDATVAITDFCGSHPVYYVGSKDGYQLSSRLFPLRPHCGGQISREALYFYAARGSVGIFPPYSGVKQVLPGTVMWFSGPSVQECKYVNWTRIGTANEYDCDSALRAFVDTASSYLEAVTRGEERVGCLLSGGIDSAIVAWLLKRIHPRVTCFTADYGISRYSEYAQANAHANKLGLEHRRVLVTRRDHWAAFRKMNSAQSDLPSSHGQLTSLYKIAEDTRRLGIRVLVSGDNADTLFMGLEGFFSGLPTDANAYMRRAEQFSAEEKLDRVVRWSDLDRRGHDILTALGIDSAKCERWIEASRSSDRNLFRPLASQFPLWRFQQIAGQYWAGVPYQCCWLPAEHTSGVRFVSPYLDFDMARFGVSLPLPLKFQAGIRKYLLFRLLEREAGIRVQKRSSPNPARVWTIFPDTSLPLRLDRRLTFPYFKWCARNLTNGGTSHAAVTNVAALGLWLKAHGLDQFEVEG